MSDRELDALVAEKVMGKSVHHGPVCMGPECENQKDYCAPCGMVPEYSTDIADAWLVIEKMKTPERHIEVIAHRGEPHWICRISTVGETRGAGDDSVARAICLAALRVFGVEVPQ